MTNVDRACTLNIPPDITNVDRIGILNMVSPRVRRIKVDRVSTRVPQSIYTLLNAPLKHSNNSGDLPVVPVNSAFCWYSAD